MKKIIVFLVMLAVMLAPFSCFAEVDVPSTETASEAATESATESAAESETETETEESVFMFEPQRFVGNLKYMLSGMIGIFVVIGLIVIVTVILNKVTSHGGKK